MLPVAFGWLCSTIKDYYCNTKFIATVETWKRHSGGNILSQYVRAQIEAVLWVLHVAHLPWQPQSWRWLNTIVCVSLSAGSPHTWLVSQPFNPWVSQRTGWMVTGAAAMSMWYIKLSLSGVTRVVWRRRTWCHSIIHVDMRLRGQSVHMRPLLWFCLVRDRWMPGDVILMLQVRNCHPGLLESRSSQSSWSRRSPVALSVAAGIAGRVGAQEYWESRDAVDCPLQCCNFRKPFATEVMVQGNTQGIEGLVVVHDTFSLTDIGSHTSSFRADGSIPLLCLSFLWVTWTAGWALTVLVRCRWSFFILTLAQHAKFQLFLGKFGTCNTAAAHPVSNLKSVLF